MCDFIRGAKLKPQVGGVGRKGRVGSQWQEIRVFKYAI